MALIPSSRAKMRLPGVPVVPKAPQMPGVRKPIVAPKPMGASDIEAGTSAGEGFSIGLDFGSTGSGRTTASRSAATAAASKANTAAKIAFEKQKLAAAAARNRAQADYIKGLLSGTEYRSAIDNLLTKVGEQEGIEKGAITGQYGTARTNLGTLYGTGETPSATSARGMTSAGYATLSDWLSKNAPTAYANMPAVTATPMTNVLEQYQRAQGVDPTAVNAAVAAANVAGAGGASNYNTLINILKGAEATSQASRMAEAQQARNLADARLLAAYNQQLGGLNAQEAAALATLAQRYGGTRLSAEQAAITRRQQLEDVLRALQGY